MNNILVTGAAGFIGYHFCELLLAKGLNVVGLDNINSYYDPELKKSRLNRLLKSKNFTFYKVDISVNSDLMAVFNKYEFDGVVNLAAQAGVRHSISHPQDYIDSNLVGFANILECCRHNKIKHLVYASSSSVYGASQNYPFSEKESVNHPLALYGATKKANEIMAHSYASLFNLPSTGLRFFTVYGPWGRPDMALFKFLKAILNDDPIDIYNHGKMLRDFTYVDDIVEGIYRVMLKPAEPNFEWDAKAPDSSSSYCPWRVYNIGRGKPVELMEFIRAIEKKVGKKANKNLLPLQPGDVVETVANTDLLHEMVGYRPQVDTTEGIEKFIEWYSEYYKTDLQTNKLVES